MKKNVIFICILLFSVKIANCQTKDIRIMVGGGLSTHGTGDLPGYSFFNQVDIHLNKHFFLSPGLQFTNHSQTSILRNGFNINYVTAGINIFTNINYLILNRSRHKIAIGAGPLVRFENSSLPSQVGLNLAQSGEYVLILKYDKLRNTSVGYQVTPAYYYRFSDKLFLGAKFILQNDTNGDIITSSLGFVALRL